MNKTFPRLLSVALLGLLAACSRGPDTTQLQADLQQRMNAALGTGLLEVRGFRRYGSQPLAEQAEGEGDRVAIYYKAELELLKGHRFSDWNEQSIGALHQVLGAAVKGVEGIEAQGNTAGDVLIAHGLSIYRVEGEIWQDVPFRSDSPQSEVPAAGGVLVSEIDSENALAQDDQLLWHQDINQQIQQLAKSLSSRQDTAGSSHLQTQLQSVITRAKLKQLRAENQWVVMSGSPTGNYHALAQGAAALLNQGDTPLTVVQSSGAIENIQLLEQRLARYAITQSDLAAAAYSAGDNQEAGEGSQLRALAALYPEPVQILVRADAGIDTLADLAGKRVSIGADGSGTQVNARQILGLAGVNPGSFSTLDISTSVAELLSGQLDAMFLTGALPSRYIRGADEQITLLALDESLIDTLSRESGYVPYQIGPGAYPGVREATATLAVTAVLVADEAAPDQQVTALLEALFESSAATTDFGARAASLDRARAMDGIALPLHPAARAFFERRG